jgi:TnpA family transposase
MFLLRYLSDLELRHVINTATTKSERFNKFVQWVAFGGDSVIAENVRDEQRKFIKYNHLVANLLAFHNVVACNQCRLQDGKRKASRSETNVPRNSARTRPNASTVSGITR